MRYLFLKQSRRDNTHGVQITPHKAEPQCGVPKQSLRGNTREAQVTPHKASAAVWGLSHKATAAVWGLLILAATMLVSCDRGSHSITGDYSYKLSGEVKLTDADGEVTYRLLHRNGQMNILKDKSDKGRYLITMNEMNGGCYTMTARLNGDNLTIDQHEFTTNILSTNTIPDIDLIDEEDPSIVYRITASGGGTCNGDILIITEMWDGYQSGTPRATLRGAEMTIIAERN